MENLPNILMGQCLELLSSTNCCQPRDSCQLPTSKRFLPVVGLLLEPVLLTPQQLSLVDFLIALSLFRPFLRLDEAAGYSRLDRAFSYFVLAINVNKQIPTLP